MDKPLNSFGQEESTELDGSLDSMDDVSSPDLEAVLEEYPELAAKLVEHRQEKEYE